MKYENVNKYLSRCGRILADLKEKVSVEGQDFNLILNPDTTAAWNALNADVRAELDKEEELTTLDLIKVEALKIKRRLEEKQRKSTNGDGTSRVLNNNQINQISNNTQQEDEVDAIGRKCF